MKIFNRKIDGYRIMNYVHVKLSLKKACAKKDKREITISTIVGL